MDRAIALIGFMGSGKDTAGREVARRSGRIFVSTDRLVELKTGKTVKDIFAQEGEDVFRGYEHTALAMLAATRHTIIATGGGIVLRPENRALLRKLGRVVHLHAPLDAIQKRLKGCRARPLASEEDRIAVLYRDREGMYDDADLTVDTGEHPPHEIARRIIEDLGIGMPPVPDAPLTVTVNAGGVSCPIVCGTGVLNDPGILTPMTEHADRACIVTDPLVGALYLDPLEQTLRSVGIEVNHLIVPPGEQAKTLDEAAWIFDQLMAGRFSRSDLLIGLGGGTVSDLTGFVAATFKRGMRCAFLPTTLLGHVDAAIGGKNGVNHEHGKNMIGTFYQPEQVIADTKTLCTLPEEEFRNGMAEVIKYGIAFDRDLFMFLEQKMDALKARDMTALVRVIRTCIEIKSVIVTRDERETRGMRGQLNFGHTVGHAIETLTRYRAIRHGEAVAIGMAVEARAAMDRGDLDGREYDRIIDLIAGYGLPTALPEGLSIQCVRELCYQDKKVRGGTIALSVLQGIGRNTIKEVPCNEFL